VGVADEDVFNAGEPISGVCDEQAPRNLHCAIQSLAADRFVHQPPSFRLHADSVADPMRMCMSAAGVPNGARQPLLRARRHREGRTKVLPPATRSGSRHPRQYEDPQESANSKAPARGCAGDGRNYRALACLSPQRHGFIEESAVVGGRFFGPLATGSAPGTPRFWISAGILK